MTAPPASVLQDLSRPECVDLLATSVVGRIGVTLDGRPVILPVNFAVVAGWSVLVRGTCTEVADPVQLERLRAVPLDRWVSDGGADRYVLISLTEISGRRFDHGTRDSGSLSRARPRPG